jgi:hypothetical protein
MILPLRNLSISIKRPVDAVYEFASRPQNLPLWASGLTGSIWKEDEAWVADSPLGRVKILFCEKNEFGVLDHDVILESGERFHNPMRAIKNHN